MTTAQQAEQMSNAPGFVAALDQSGGSTPKALALYGVDAGQYASDDEMFDLIHEMRCRIMTSPAFKGDHVIAAILFENTMDRTVEGKPVADYLWQERQVVPFLKVDKGLADEESGGQILKEMPDLDALLVKAKAANIFGTKMRSVIHRADETGVDRVVSQQFNIGRQILSHCLVPIIEPEVNVNASDKADAEQMLLSHLKKHLDQLADNEKVMLKLTLPEQPNLYADLVAHPNVMRVVALSGGYSRDEANRRLSENNGVIASFSRALTEGLSAQQSGAAFDEALGQTIAEIAAASSAGG